MIGKRERPAVVLCAMAMAAALGMSSANAQPSPPRAEPPPTPNLSPPPQARTKDCTGGKESADHKTAMKVECFSVKHSIFSADVRDKDGDEGKVRKAICAKHVNGTRTCTLTVEIAAQP